MEYPSAIQSTQMTWSITCPTTRPTQGDATWLRKHQITQADEETRATRWGVVEEIDQRGLWLRVLVSVDGDEGKPGRLVARQTHDASSVYRLDNASDVDRAVQILVQGSRFLAAARA